MFKRYIVILLVLFGSFYIAHASAPMAKKQVPGYFRMQLGAFEITALNDGISKMNTAILNNIEKSDMDRILEQFLIADNAVPAAINTFLINTGQKLILVDTGMGRFFDNLKESGYQPSQVDMILITHMHGDHVGGLNDSSGKAMFPNAEVYVSKLENDSQNAENIARLSAGYKGKWYTFDYGTEIIPGITAIDARGHTPGHTVFLIESEGKKLYIWGDIIHASAVQFPRPEVTINYDTDKKLAAETRISLMRTISSQNAYIAGMHIPFPGLGRISSREENSYIWIPVPYLPLP